MNEVKILKETLSGAQVETLVRDLGFNEDLLNQPVMPNHHGVYINAGALHHEEIAIAVSDDHVVVDNRILAFSIDKASGIIEILG
jgi:hypothetical protein